MVHTDPPVMVYTQGLLCVVFVPYEHLGVTFDRQVGSFGPFFRGVGFYIHFGVVFYNYRDLTSFVFTARSDRRLSAISHSVPCIGTSFPFLPVRPFWHGFLSGPGAW